MLCLVLAACSGAPDVGAPTTTRAPLPAAPLPTPVDGPALPLDAFRVHADDGYALGRAETVLANACLASFGVDEELALPDRQALRDAEAVDASRLYGLTDPVAAQQYGYDAPPVAQAPADPELDEEENVVLLGSDGSTPQELDPTESPGTRDGRPLPVGGCLGEARQRLYGSPSPRAHFTFATDLAARAWETARTSAEVQQAVRDWSACMADNGLSQADPMQPDLEGASPDEQRAIAVADVGCKSATGLVRTWRARNAEEEAVLVSQNAERLAAEREALDAALGQAVSVG